MFMSNHLIGFGARQRIGVPGNDANTKLLLHYDGSFVDSSIGGAHGTPTVVGDAVIDAADFIFGSGGFKNTTTGYITFPNSTDWNLGGIAGGDFTIDTRMKITTYNSATAVIVSVADNASTGWEWYATAAGSILRHSAGTLSTVSWSISTGVWYHFALVRSGGTITVYKDGVSQGTHTDMDMDNQSHLLSIGSLDGVGSVIPTMRQDEFRLVKGVAKWTANFTPPAAQYI